MLEYARFNIEVVKGGLVFAPVATWSTETSHIVDPPSIMSDQKLFKLSSRIRRHNRDPKLWEALRSRALLGKGLDASIVPRLEANGGWIQYRSIPQGSTNTGTLFLRILDWVVGGCPTLYTTGFFPPYVQSKVRIAMGPGQECLMEVRLFRSNESSVLPFSLRGPMQCVMFIHPLHILAARSGPSRNTVQ